MTEHWIKNPEGRNVVQYHFTGFNWYTGHTNRLQLIFQSDQKIKIIKTTLHKLPCYSHKTFKKASTLLHPAALQALQMCSPLLSDLTLVYTRSPLGSTCILPVGTMSVTSPLLPFNIQVICGLSAALARHSSVTPSPSSAVMLLGTAVNTGRSKWQ